jgi:exopolysaccharide biosynthesis polyprenyl glycosylphosphotransferase
MASSFLLRPLLISRVFLVAAFFFALILTVLIRLSLSMLDRWLGTRGIVLNRFVVLGLGDSSAPFIRRLNAFNGSLRVTGAITLEREQEGGLPRNGELPSLGNIDDIEAIYSQQRFTGLVFATNGYDYVCHPTLKDAVMGALNFCESRGIPFYIVPDSLDVAVARSEVGSFCGFPVIRLRDSAVHPVYGAVKRIMDVSLSLVGLILGLPLWVGIAAAIKLTSKGPVLYSQVRMGTNGKPFRMYKFRTMVRNAEKLLNGLVDFDALKEPVFKLKNDPRVTPLGRFLRRTGLDEAPQLVNVLVGQMSLVGPRPEQVELVDKYSVWQKRRLKGKPGITGYQQVMSRGDPLLSRRVDYDLYYLKNQSFLLDLFILCKTVVVVLKGEGIN